ncbi:MAG: cysteine--tRNA ligase, partial [Elusimicrobiota bacterium]|nr:cysteine--tRNA ligase [Elusimicrobiota bacterium]
MDFKIYNTLTRQKEIFKPIKSGEAGIYTCGPTVYHYAHIGNLRTYISEDTFVRAMKFFGYKLKRVMNITDVGHLTSDADSGEDKMEVGARREGKSAWDVAKFYTE